MQYHLVLDSVMRYHGLGLECISHIPIEAVFVVFEVVALPRMASYPMYTTLATASMPRMHDFLQGRETALDVFGMHLRPSNSHAASASPTAAPTPAPSSIAYPPFLPSFPAFSASCASLFL